MSYLKFHGTRRVSQRLLRVAARPAPPRPAKVVVLEARRQARRQQAPVQPLPPRAA